MTAIVGKLREEYTVDLEDKKVTIDQRTNSVRKNQNARRSSRIAPIGSARDEESESQSLVSLCGNQDSQTNRCDSNPKMTTTRSIKNHRRPMNKKTRILTIIASLLFFLSLSGDISPANELPVKPDVPSQFSPFEHGWILWHLSVGDVETLYESDDLGGVFVYVIALQRTIGERAPAVYDRDAHVQLILALSRFSVSGHNLEDVLDAYLRKPDDFFNGMVKTLITPRSAQLEAEAVMEDFGPEQPVTKRIEAGIKKFAGGAMAALEKKYKSANDGVRPPNVSEEEFAKDPTIGKKQIMRFGEMYAYYDAEIIRKHSGGSRYATGYTLSPTPPNAEVESIDEWCTFYKADVWQNGEDISKGRTIPRANVVPVPLIRGEYINLHGNRVFGEAFYYSPPSTASVGEGGKATPIVAASPSGKPSALSDGHGESEQLSDDGSRPPLLQVEEKDDPTHDPEFRFWSNFEAGTIVTLITTHSVNTKNGRTVTDKYSLRDQYRIESAKPEWIEISCDEVTLNEGKQYQPSSKLSMGVGLNTFMGNSLYTSRRQSPWMSCVTGQPFRTNSLAILKTGIETLNVGGQRLTCRWFTTEKKPGKLDSHNATFWICDQIPGRFVRCVIHDDDNVISETVIQSLNLVK